MSTPVTHMHTGTHTHTHLQTHTDREAGTVKCRVVICPCRSFPLSGGNSFLFSSAIFICPLMNAAAIASILLTCQGSQPLDPSQDWSPHSLDQMLSFHTSICLSIHPTAYPSTRLLPAISLSVEVMIPLLISALWT